MPKRIKIVIAEIIPSKNKGEEAILAGMIETFKCLGSTEITLFSRTIDDDRERYSNYPIKIVSYENKRYKSSNSFLIRRCGDIFTIMQFLFHAAMAKFKITPILNRFIDECWIKLHKCDIIIIGHDNIFSNGVGIRYLAILLFAKILNIKMVVYESSIGPIKSKLMFKLTKMFLNNVDLVTIREPISYRYVMKELGILKNHIFLTADTAFLLKPVNKERSLAILENVGINVNSLIVGLTVSKYTVEEVVTINGSHEDIYNRFIATVANILDKIVEDLNATAIIIPHVVGPAINQDDRIIAADIMKHVNNKEKIFNLNNEYTAQELKGIIGECDMLIGSRTHSLIAAAGMFVPAVALSDTKRHKTNGIVRVMLEQNECLYNVEQLDSVKLWEKIASTWLNRKEIKKHLESKMNELINLASKNGVLLKNLIT